MILLVPVSLDTAKQVVRDWHSHHDPMIGHMWSTGALVDWELAIHCALYYWEAIDRVAAERDSLATKLSTLEQENGRMRAVCVPKLLDEWHEDHGSVLWWLLPVQEPPYCGTPLDDDWPFEDDERPVWTVLQLPIDTALATTKKDGQA